MKLNSCVDKLLQAGNLIPWKEGFKRFEKFYWEV